MANIKLYIIPNARTVTAAVKESESYFLCPANTVMTGRYHTGDENGNTFYYSGIITTQFNPEENIRVIVALHPDEKYYPMEPLDFIKRSRFRKHVSEGSDDGYSKVKHAFVNDDSHATEYYDIPVAVINTFYIGDFQKNLRPRDDNSLGSGEVFLQPDDHTVGDNNPTGRVAVFTHSSTYVKDGQTREQREF